MVAVVLDHLDQLLQLSVAMTVALWVIFDRIFAITWSPSQLGNLMPSLRAATGWVL